MDIERLAVAAVEESISRTNVLSPFVMLYLISII